MKRAVVTTADDGHVGSPLALTVNTTLPAPVCAPAEKPTTVTPGAVTALEPPPLPPAPVSTPALPPPVPPPAPDVLFGAPADPPAAPAPLPFAPFPLGDPPLAPPPAPPTGVGVIASPPAMTTGASVPLPGVGVTQGHAAGASGDLAYVGCPAPTPSAPEGPPGAAVELPPAHTVPMASRPIGEPGSGVETDRVVGAASTQARSDDSRSRRPRVLSKSPSSSSTTIVRAPGAPPERPSVVESRLGRGFESSWGAPGG